MGKSVLIKLRPAQVPGLTLRHVKSDAIHNHIRRQPRAELPGLGGLDRGIQLIRAQQHDIRPAPGLPRQLLQPDHGILGLETGLPSLELHPAPKQQHRRLPFRPARR